MTDVHAPEIRRKNMQAIKGRDTKPEVFIRKSLHKLGFRYRVSPSKLPGQPDIYLARYKAVIFVNGCFWHGHGCYLFRWPRTRQDFWLKKINGNVARDDKNLNLLREQGYRILVVWECALKGRLKCRPAMLIEDIKTWLLTGGHFAEFAHEHE